MPKTPSYPIVRDEAMKRYYQAGTMARANKLYSMYVQGNEPIPTQPKPTKQAPVKPKEDVLKQKTNGKYKVSEVQKIDAYAKKQGFKKMNPTYVYDGDTFYEGYENPIRVKNVNAPEVANKHKGTSDKPMSREAQSRLQQTVNNYQIYGKNIGEKTHDRSVYEIMYGDDKNFMRLDSMMATDGFSMPATKFTTPELEKMKKGNSKTYNINLHRKEIKRLQGLINEYEKQGFKRNDLTKSKLTGFKIKGGNLYRLSDRKNPILDLENQIRLRKVLIEKNQR